jgi:hypothetical protein
MECLYLTSNWPYKFHPDSCGLLFVAYNDSVIKAYKLNPGKLTRSAIEVLEIIKQKYPVIVEEYKELVN